MGQFLVLDDDFRDFLRYPFAGAQIEGHPRPAPVVHLGLDGDERLGITVLGFTARLFKVPGHRLPGGPALGVLPFDYAVGHCCGVDTSQGLYNFYLFIPNALGFQAVGRFHGDEAKKLHQVVLHHIP